MPHQIIAIFACMMVILGLFWARAIFATGIIILLCNALINKNVLQIWQQLFKHKVLLSVFFLFIVYVFSGFWSSNTAYFLSKLQLHLPFLAIPLGVLSFPNLDTKHLKWIFYAFIIGCFGGAVWSSNIYFTNKEMYDFGYGFSHVIPTPFKGDHIRFSIAIVMAIWFGYFCIIHENNKFIKFSITIITVLLIIYLHILSVKTSLLAFYFLLIAFLLFTLIVEKKWKWSLLLLGMVIFIPTVAFVVSNTFRNKIYYTIYSLKQICNANAEANISDEGRIISYQLALPIIKKNIIFGIGAGDVYDEMSKQYKDKFGKNSNVNVLQPHNQIMVMLLVAGIIGAIFYLFFLFIPWLYSYKKSLLFIGFWVILFVPQMVEPFHETQYGITIHIFFYALIIRYLDFQYQKKIINNIPA